MSDDERESRGGGGGVGGDEGEQQQHKVRRIGKAKLLFGLPFRKLVKHHRRGRSRTPPPPPYEEDLGKGCYLCFLPPRVPPNSALSPNPSGPSGSKPPSYSDFLKSLIEKNDFYSPDCNVHRDIRWPEMDGS